MTTMKIGTNCNIKKWRQSQRFNTFQDYLPRCLQITGAKRGEQPEAYGKMKKREILKFALPTAYQKKLCSDGQCLSEVTYERSIGKIVKVKPEILLKIKQLETTRNNAKAILELQEKAGLHTKTGIGKGKHRNRDKDKSVQKGNGLKDENGYYLCGNCGKTNKGVYCKPIPGTGSDKGGDDAPQKWMIKSATKNYIKQIATSETKKKNKKEKEKDVVVAAAQNYQAVRRNHGGAV